VIAEEIKSKITIIVIVKPRDEVQVQCLIVEMKGPQGPWVNSDRLFYVFEWNSGCLTSSWGEGPVILRGCGFHLGHLIPECLDVLLHEVTVIHRPEEDPTLPLTLSLPTVSAAFRATTGWHSSSGRSSGWSKKRRELDVTVPDSVSSLLLRHDMIEPFLWGRELALWPARGDFAGGIAVLSCYGRRSGGGGGGSRGEWRWDERGA